MKSLINKPKLDIKEIDSLALALWDNEIVNLVSSKPHHTKLFVGLRSEHIDQIPKIRSLTINGLISLCDQKQTEFDIVWAKSSWAKSFARKKKKPYFEKVNRNSLKFLAGKTVLLISNEFYLFQIIRDLEIITTLGGEVKDVIAVYFERDQQTRSLLLGLENSLFKIKVRYLLTQEKILKAKPQLVVIKK